MAKDKKIKNSRIKSGSLHEDWLAGKGHKYSPGQVVESKNSSTSLGVIQFALTAIETYAVKWYVGPNPWDFLEGECTSFGTFKSDKKNPLNYKWSQRVPGPSSDQIDALEEKFAKAAIIKARSAREVEQHIAILEEEMSKKKKFDIDETKVDSIADETLEEDLDIPIDGVNKKITTILEEE